jgi:hypothetical protein
MHHFEILSIKRNEYLGKKGYEVIYLKDGVRWKNDFISENEMTDEEILIKIQND